MLAEGAIGSIDFFIVPTVRFEILYVLVVLAHERRRIVHLNVTANPTARWTARQMIDDARHLAPVNVPVFVWLREYS